MPQAGLELNKTTVISSDEALILEKAPKTMAIVGAGAVGCEFADVFNAFGTQVTLIDVAPAILPLEDGDCSAELAKSFKKRKIDVVTAAKIGNVKVGAGSVSMTIDAGGKTQTLEVEQVLVAAGRAPNVEDIGLKEAGVQLTDRGFIKINEKMETTAKGIYAIGDVAGPPMLAHKGSREGVVLRRAARRRSARAARELRKHSERDLLSSRSRVGRTHRSSSARRRSSTTRSASSPSRPTAARARRARPKDSSRSSATRSTARSSARTSSARTPRK